MKVQQQLMGQVSIQEVNLTPVRRLDILDKIPESLHSGA
jgi:hypothetical protein